jgi:hypothetical protein
MHRHRFPLKKDHPPPKKNVFKKDILDYLTLLRFRFLMTPTLCCALQFSVQEFIADMYIFGNREAI